MDHLDTNVSLREATLDDAAALHRLIERAYRGEAARGGWTHESDLLDGQRTDEAAIRETLRASDHRILIALDGTDALIGCVQISDLGDGLGYLGLLSVDPDCQAAGIGKQLIAAAEARATALFGAERIELTVIRQRPELIAYYERRGYALTGETRPFPYGDERFGLPQLSDLAFVVLQKQLMSPAA